MKVVLDTSVIISLLGSSRKSFVYDLIVYAEKRLIQFVANKETYSEIQEVIDRPRFKKWIGGKNPKWLSDWERLKPLIELVKDESKSVNKSHKNYEVLANRDEKDLKFLYLCELEKVDILITQDKDLLDIDTHDKTKILRPYESFLLVKKLLSEG